jgi:hypothetical protein
MGKVLCRRKTAAAPITGAAAILFLGGNFMNNKKLILITVALVALIGLFLGLYLMTKPEASLGTKEFTVTVVHSDGTEKVFNYNTDAEKLGAYLEEQGLIESQGADAGMFHTVDGEKADWNVNQSYWAFYLGEDYAMTGIYDTDIADGGIYKLVYTIG